MPMSGRNNLGAVETLGVESTKKKCQPPQEKLMVLEKQILPTRATAGTGDR